jgi:hypothetical protein
LDDWERTVTFSRNKDGESHSIFVDNVLMNNVRTAPLYRQTPEGFVRFGWCCEAYDDEFQTWYTLSVGTSSTEMTQEAERILKDPRFAFKCPQREKEENEVTLALVKELQLRESVSFGEALRLLDRNNADKKLKGVPTLMECLHAHRRAKVEERAAREKEVKKPLRVEDVEDPEIAELLKLALS